MACHARVDCAYKWTYNFVDQTVIMRPGVQDLDLKGILDFQFSFDSVAICFDSVSILFAFWYQSGFRAGSCHSILLSNLFQSV